MDEEEFGVAARIREPGSRLVVEAFLPFIEVLDMEIPAGPGSVLDFEHLLEPLGIHRPPVRRIVEYAPAIPAVLLQPSRVGPLTPPREDPGDIQARLSKSPNELDGIRNRGYSIAEAIRPPATMPDRSGCRAGWLTES